MVVTPRPRPHVRAVPVGVPVLAAVLATALPLAGPGPGSTGGAGGWAGPGLLAAQQRTDTLPPPPQRRDTVLVPPPPISPGQAFFRSLAVPGWGHASIGSYTRGGFYFAAEAATAFMMVRVSGRQGAAEAVRALRAEEVEAEALAQGITDPLQIEDLVEADPEVQDAQRLVDARDQQFEDWLALGVFLVFLGGADAYVSAHLANFPEPIDVRPVLEAPDRYGVAVSVPLGRQPGR